MSTTTTLVKAVRTMFTAGTFSESSPLRGVRDLRTTHGGFLTIKITNASTGPTAQPVANILVAHNDSGVPSAGPAGTDWKTIYSIAHVLTANAVGEYFFEIPPGVMHLEVELRGATGTSPTGEAIFSEISSVLNT